MKTYARVENGQVQQIIPPIVWDVEGPDWQEGDPSRIGQEIPIDERYAPWVLEQLVDITDENPMPEEQWFAEQVDGKWEFRPYSPPLPPYEWQALSVRFERDQRMRQYDAGISMAMRYKRMSTKKEERDYADSKIKELDVYAEALLLVPQQPGFPYEIEWPEQPEK